jgi:hypothetical protein
MRSRSTQTRRIFLRYMALGTIAVAAAGRVLGAQAWADASVRRCARALVRAAMPRQGSAARLGAAYLRTAPPRDRDVGPLVAAVRSSHPDLAAALDDDLDPGHVKDAVRHRIELDFASGAVVTVDGWVISLTEARIAALAHLV